MRLKRIIACLLVLISLFLMAGAFSQEYQTLQEGMTGKDVLRLKQAMYYLGYFTSLNLSDSYNHLMAERVKQLQKNNGLEETGIADPALQELIYSGNCVPSENAPKPTAVPTQVPAPIHPEEMPDDIPPCDENGLLIEPGEYIHEDPDAGLWIYKSQDCSIEIKRYQSKAEKLIWFQCDVVCTPSSPMKSILSEGRTPGKAYKSPIYLAESSNTVMTITDDYFGHRLNYNKRPGIVIRNGRIISQETYSNNKAAFPNLEVIALFPDGSLKCFESSAHTAQEYLDMGVISTFAFGPILVSDGVIDPRVLDKNYYHYREPRCALGMIEPYHYIALIVKGRSDDSKGIYLDWLAEKMLELGAVEAINLDGGGTVALVFMNKMLNKNTKNLRNVTSVIGFGTLQENDP